MMALPRKSKGRTEIAGSPPIDLKYLLFPDTPDQARFHADAYRVRNRLVSCGTGAGKTKAGAMEDISWALENPGSVGYVYMPTYRLIHRVLLPTLCDLLRVAYPEESPLVKEYAKGGGYIEFLNGSKLYFGSLEEPEMAEGTNIDYAHIDEARLIRNLDLALKTVQRRLRGSGLTQKGPGIKRQGLWVTTTPDFPGSTLFKAFEDPKERLPGAKVYRWATSKNITLPPEYVAGILATHTGGLAERFIHGRFAAAEATTWPFDATVHVLDTLPEGFQAVKAAYGADWGWTNPTAILAVLFDGDGRAYVVDEFYKAMAKDEEVAEAAKEMAQRWGPGMFWCDSAEPRSIDKLRQAGLQASPNTSKREEGIREVGSRFQIAGDGRPRIFVLGACVNFISELQTYDAGKKEHDHLCDSVRYCILGTTGNTGPQLLGGFGREEL